MMAISNRLIVSALIVLAAGCATGPKNMAPVNEQQKSELIKGLDVVEQPAIEPEWGDYVKDHYPNWRQHYWVDRGQWGNRGYVMGKPTAENEPLVETQITPLPPVTQAPTIIESEPPKIEQADKPTKYVVKKGDSLWKIAGKVYHNPLKWPKIYKANKDKIKNPNRIHPGQVLIIPWE